MHPEELVRPPPAKDRKAGTSGAALSPTPTHGSGFPNDSSESLPTSPLHPAPAYRLARERNRLTLRAYLHSLMTSATLASSPVLRSFLLSNPTQLSYEEQEDAARREEADLKREEGRIRFAREIANRVEGLRNAVKSVKGDIMAKGKTLLYSYSIVSCSLRLLKFRWPHSDICYYKGNQQCERPTLRVFGCSRMGPSFVSFQRTSF